MENIAVHVGNMSCEHCVRAVEKALEAAPGVIDARVDLKSEQAVVSIDPAAASVTKAGCQYLGIMKGA